MRSAVSGECSLHPNIMGSEGYSERDPSWMTPGCNLSSVQPGLGRAAVVDAEPSNFTRSRRQQKRAGWRRPGAVGFTVTPAVTAAFYLLRRFFNTALGHLGISSPSGGGRGATRARIFYPSPSPATPPSFTRLVHLLACILLDPHPPLNDPRRPPPPNCPGAFPIRPGAAAIHFPATSSGIALSRLRR
jgi:hypothetical protein